MYSSAPSLPWELVEGVLNIGIQLAHPSHQLPSRGEPGQIYALITVGPRTCIPSCTVQALYKLWWIDVDSASRIGFWLLDLMLKLSHRSYRPRPLQAGSSGLRHAARIGSVDVLEWWYRAGLICRDADMAEVPEEASAHGQVAVLQWYQERRRNAMSCACLDSVAAALEGGWIEVLKWWAQFSSLDQEHGQFEISRAFAKSAAAGAQSIEVLEWLASTRPWGIGSFPSASQGQAIVQAASRAGSIEVLNWWLERQAVDWNVTISSILDVVIKNGNLSVLWWLKAHVPNRTLLKDAMAVVAVDDLCAQGNVEMLTWWHAHAPGNRLTVGTLALDRASRNGHVSVLEFFMHIKQLDFTFQDPISAAASTHSMAVLDWWAASGRIDLSKYGKKLDLIAVCKQASELSPLPVIQWFMDHGICLQFPAVAIGHLMQHGHVDVLDYLVDKQIDFELPIKEGLDIASECGHTSVLKWWMAQGFKPVYSEWALASASKSGHIHVLEWWKNDSGLPLKYSAAETVRAAATGLRPVEVMEWWIDSHFMDRATIMNEASKWIAVVSLPVLKWLGPNCCSTTASQASLLHDWSRALWDSIHTKDNEKTAWILGTFGPRVGSCTTFRMELSSVALAKGNTFALETLFSLGLFEPSAAMAGYVKKRMPPCSPLWLTSRGF